MLIQRKYLIRTQKEISSVQYEDQLIEFKLEDQDQKKTILFEGQIGDFNTYEKQLIQNLIQLGLKHRPWIKNIFYFSVPNNLSETQIAFYFNSADVIGAIKTYVLHENIALLLTSRLKSYQQKTTCILSVYASKIEIAIMKDLKFKAIKTLYASEELMIEIPNIHQVVERHLLKLSDQFTIDKYFLVSNKPNLYKNLKNIKPFERIDDSNQLILEGLKIASIEGCLEFFTRK